MNTKMLKGMTAAVSLITGMGAASPALATLTLPQMLGPTETAMDVWTFSCPGGTASAQARVYDLLPVVNNPARMKVVLGHDGTPFPSAQAIDLLPAATFGEGPPPSLFAVVADGPGLYAMAFIKTTPAGGAGVGGPEDYRGEAICVNAGGGITNPVFLTKRIDQ